MIIGDRVVIGHQVTLHACTIENAAMVGIGSIVLDMARIGERAMLGAGSLLTPRKILQPETLWLGSPARLLRTRRTEEIEATAKTVASYVKLIQRYQTASDAHFNIS